MKPLESSFTHFSQTERIDEIDDPLQRCFDNRLAGSRRGKSQNRALPQVLIAALRDRDVELIAYPRLNAFQDSALALE